MHRLHAHKKSHIHTRCIIYNTNARKEGLCKHAREHLYVTCAQNIALTVKGRKFKTRGRERRGGAGQIVEGFVSDVWPVDQSALKRTTRAGSARNKTKVDGNKESKRSEERRVGKSVDLGERRKSKKKRK